VTYDVDLVYKSVYLTGISIGDTYSIILSKPNPNANRDVVVLKEMPTSTTTINPFTFDQNDTNWTYDSMFVLADSTGMGLKIPIVLPLTYVDGVASVDLDDISSYIKDDTINILIDFS
jgi:hypothetical protein